MCRNACLIRKSQLAILENLYSHESQKSPIRSICRGPEIAPTKRSTIARFRMSRYVPRLLSCCWDTNTIMVMILSITMARHSMISTTIHGVHCDARRNSMLLDILLRFSRYFPQIKSPKKMRRDVSCQVTRKIIHKWTERLTLEVTPDVKFYATCPWALLYKKEQGARR